MMTNDPEIRTGLNALFQDLPNILDTKIANYFANGVEEFRPDQSEAVLEYGGMTIHQFIMWVAEDETGIRLAQEFPKLGEIERTPLNHFDPLYPFYDAVINNL